MAVANGVRSIEHGNLLDAPTAALMAERNAFLIPLPGYREQFMAQLLAGTAAGLDRVAVGTQRGRGPPRSQRPAWYSAVTG